MPNAWGRKKIENYIYEMYSPKTKTVYVVWLHNNYLNVFERFDTIEEARKYRDFVLTQLEIKKYQHVKHELNFKDYPLNIIQAVGWKKPMSIEEFNNTLNNLPISATERDIINSVFQRDVSIKEIAEKYSITYEGARIKLKRILTKLSYYDL